MQIPPQKWAIFTFNSARVREEGEKKKKKKGKKKEKKKEKGKKEEGKKKKKRRVSVASPYNPKVSSFRPFQELYVVVRMCSDCISAMDG